MNRKGPTQKTMEVLKRIVLTVAIGLLVLTTGLGTTAYALAMDGESGHCAGHMSMLQDAKSASNSDIDTPQHEVISEYADGDHDECMVHSCPAVIDFALRIPVDIVHFDLAQAGFESDLHHLSQAETPDRPPNT